MSKDLLAIDQLGGLVHALSIVSLDNERRWKYSAEGAGWSWNPQHERVGADDSTQTLESGGGGI